MVREMKPAWRASRRRKGRDYNPAMPTESDRQFTLQQAAALLPDIQRLTRAAVDRSEPLARQLDALGDTDPLRASIAASLNDIVERWSSEVRALGAEVKGLWLVDFDNGEGYYCWCYPEETVAHYHGYDEGFAGRMTIQ